MSNKGYMGKNESFAKGGAVLGKESEFMKSPDRFRQEEGTGKFCPAPDVPETNDCFVKDEKPEKGIVTAPPAKGKQLKTVKPRD